jgi:tetratricopeptide (TPR) repeat protein
MFRKLLADCFFRWGGLSLSLGRLGSGYAFRCFRLTRRLWPNHPQVGPWLDYMEGVRALLKGRPDQALELLRTAARGLPQVPGIRARLGVAYTMLGRDEEAIAALEKVLYEDTPGLLPDVWTSLAWSYLRSGRTPQALETCRRAERSEVQSPRLQMIQRLALGVQVGGLSVNELRDLLRALPQGIPLVLEFARLQAAAGRHRLARSTLAALPQELQARSYFILGQASLNGGDRRTALWAGHQLERYPEEDAQAHSALLRSEVHLQEGRLAEALAIVREVRDRLPDDGLLREQLGRLLLLSGQWEAAVEEMIEALHAGSGGALAAGLAALAAIELGDARSARGVFTVQRMGDGLACAFAHTAQARLMVLDGNWDEALGLAECALGEIGQLPEWATTPAVLSHLGAALRSLLRAARDAGSEPQCQQALALTQRLDETLANLSAASPALAPND